MYCNAMKLFLDDNSLFVIGKDHDVHEVASFFY